MRSVFLLLIVVGVLVALAGVTFTLQGMGIVGPSDGFMFNNPAWIYQGVITTIIGLLVIIGGIILGRRSRT